MKAGPARPKPRGGAPNGRFGGFRFVAGTAGTAILLSGCSRSPSQDILGSFFPSWLLCLGLGLLIAVGSRLAMGGLGFRDDVPVPLLTDLAVALAATFLIWLLWFGH